MSNGNVVVRFADVSFGYKSTQPLLQGVDFSVRRGAKMTLMGQNGAGKSTIFQLMNGQLEPTEGDVHVERGLNIATSRQVIPPKELNMTVREFFEACFQQKVYDIDPKIDEALEIVNFKADYDRTIRSFSGGQQARLLLASALIQKPDLLLLDEPTNNLDPEGILHLTQFLINYGKTVVVISHDADFLNSFCESVLYLDIFTKKVERYTGNYFDVVKEITARIAKEKKINAQLAKKIQENKDKANFFSHKGGKMRLVAKKLRDEVKEAEENKVELVREDKTIRPFIIPVQEDLSGELIAITSVTRLINGKESSRAVNISLRKGEHLLLRGPNGIGKSTLLEAIAKRKAKGVTIDPDLEIGYYRQDFSTLNFEDIVMQSLLAMVNDSNSDKLRAIMAGFLIDKDLIYSKIGSLSEGQKGLVSMARLVLQRPGLLILDEPTNHINFRHVPVIAKALSQYEGAMILVSHIQEFVDKIRIDETLDLTK
ncbi:MAG: ATP-binding cassette domain-containing protein [bacterium]|nr:ATP-binding cassette domain-containing protein [bacterium]